VSRFPAAVRLPAFASRPSHSRRNSALLTVGLPAKRPDPDGVTAFRTHESRPGWELSLARGQRCSSRLERVPNWRPPHSQRPVPAHRHNNPSCGSLHHEASTRVQAIHPSGVPLGCDPRMGRERLGFPRASHPADQQPNDRRRGGDRPPSTDLEQHSRHIRRTSNLVFTRIVRPRVAPRVAGRVGITPDMPVAKSEQVPRPIRSQVREQRSALADHASSGHGGAAHRFVCRKGSPIETAPWATTSSMSRRSCEGSVSVLTVRLVPRPVRLGLAGPRWVAPAPNMGSSTDARACACS
jgi:hypothetical protein